MATETTEQPRAQTPVERFHTGQILSVVSGHFIHDVYTSFVAPLLPLIIEKLSLSLTAAGSLNAILQFPGLLTPLMGYLADRAALRYFLILAPGATATLISALGFAPNYFTLVLLLLVTGLCSAAFHAPAPAVIAQVSGRQVGLGMSLFMAGGELARTVGPLLAVWAVGMWTLDGFYRIVVLGWAGSLILFWRLRTVTPPASRRDNLLSMAPALRKLFVPILLITLFRNFMLDSLATYLPVYMDLQGASLWVGGAALSLLEGAGVVGALASGPLSDRIGRKPVLLGATLLASQLLLLFLRVEGWLVVPVLLALGFTTLSTAPVIMAVVQDQFPENRSFANGLFMAITFVLRTCSILAVGAMGDLLGLRAAYFWSAILALFCLPVILALPGRAAPQAD
jgi:FSR family fosmidomycin resistance protein-like MFS transporter